MKNIIEEKEQLLEMAIKFGRISNIPFLDLDYLHFGGENDTENYLYIGGMKFERTDEGWLSYIQYDVKNKETNTYRTTYIPEVIFPIEDLEYLFLKTVRVKLLFNMEHFKEIYRDKKTLKNLLQELGEYIPIDNSKRSISRPEYYDNKIKELLNK